MRRSSLLLLLLLPLLAERARAEPLELRVLTYNVWGVPIASRDRPARLAAIPGAIAELAPDVVALQELWLGDECEAMRRALAERGLPHSFRAAAGGTGGGLLVASRFPIREASFLAYQARGKAYKPQHFDFYATKGALFVLLDTPAGELLVVDTHIHARYGSEEYLPEQLSQAVELAGWVRSRGQGRPLVVLGDLNSRHDALPCRLLCEGVGLAPARPAQGIDAVYVRGGGGLGWRALGGEDVFVEPRDVGGGRSLRLSDHSGALVRLSLGEGAEGAAGGVSAEVEAEAREVLLGAASGLRAVALASLALGMALAALAFHWGAAGRRGLAAVVMAVAMGGVAVGLHEGWRAGVFEDSAARLAVLTRS